MPSSTECRELRLMPRHFTCDECGEEQSPQLACAVFEAFRDVASDYVGWRTKHWLCLSCANDSVIPMWDRNLFPFVPRQ